MLWLVVGALVAMTVLPLALFLRPPAPAPESTLVADVALAPAMPAPVSDAAAPSPVDRVDPAWVATTASETGIPDRALAAYASAALVIAQEQPQCGLDWATLAAIGWAESDHGAHDGSSITVSGVVEPGILGESIGADTDAGAIDGDRARDRAVGPLQFIPDTWTRWAADGDADRVTDPHDIDDAALTAARYLCAASGGMASARGWDAGIAAYNSDPAYRDRVAAAHEGYRAASE